LPQRGRSGFVVAAGVPPAVLSAVALAKAEEGGILPPSPGPGWPLVLPISQRSGRFFFLDLPQFTSIQPVRRWIRLDSAGRTPGRVVLRRTPRPPPRAHQREQSAADFQLSAFAISALALRPMSKIKSRRRPVRRRPGEGGTSRRRPGANAPRLEHITGYATPVNPPAAVFSRRNLDLQF